MKKTLLILITVLFPALLYSQALNGDYYIPKGDHLQGFDNLAAALTEVNNSGLDGIVNFYIDGDLNETGANCVINRSDMGPNRQLIIKPAAGKTPVITFSGCSSTVGASQYNGLTLNNTSYVTIDGSNTVGGTTKDLTLKMNDVTNGRIVICLYGNCDNVTLKNTTISYMAPMSTAATSTCFYINGQTSGVSDRILVENNTFADAVNTPFYAVRITGAAGTFQYCSDVKVTKNILFGQMRSSYFYFCGVDNGVTEFSNNQISNTSSNITGYVVYGTILNNYKGTYNIFNNKYITIKTNNKDGGQGLYGISPMSGQAGAVLNIYNNFFSDFQCLNANTAATPVFGIYCQDTVQTNIYFNSINMTPVNNTTGMVAPIGFGNSGAKANIKNNILINSYSAATDNSYGYKFPSTMTLNADYNDIVVLPTSAVTMRGARKFVTMKEWQDSTAQELHSVSLNPAFTSISDLHIMKDSLAIVGRGVKIPGFMTDIDGETRDTIPDLGADEIAGVTPVELVAFTASKSGGMVELSWSTATEVNNAYFDVERKIAGKSWESVGRIKGNGTTAQGAQYSFTDDAVAGNVSYRLKQVDFDGTFTYSATVEVSASVPDQFELSQNYPNPFNPSTVIRYSIPQDAKVKLQVYSITGQLVAELVNASQSAGVHNVTFNAAGLASGTYIYKIQAGSFVQMKKMMLIK